MSHPGGLSCFSTAASIYRVISFHKKFIFVFIELLSSAMQIDPSS